MNNHYNNNCYYIIVKVKMYMYMYFDKTYIYYKFIRDWIP